MIGSLIRDAGFHQVNQITEEIQDVEQNIQTMQEAQLSVLVAIKDNQTMMSQVVNHIGQTYIDGRYGFVPPNYVQYENSLPSEPSVNVILSV